MSGLLVTFKKELLSYLVSPVTWAIAVVFYWLRGYELSSMVKYAAMVRADPDLFVAATYTLTSTTAMVLFVPALLTMRCFAEERRTGSIEMLMTAPVRDGGVVLGKWGAAVALYALLWLPSCLLLHVIEYGSFLDTDLAFGPVLSAYLGMFLLSAMLLAFGCFASSLTDNVLLAAMLAFLFDLGLLLVPGLLRANFGEFAQHYYVRELLDKLDVGRNFHEGFARGLVDTSQVAFYLGGMLFFLLLTAVSVTSRRIA